MDTILENLELFLKENNLKLNVDKTQLLRTTSRQQLAKNGNEKVILTATDKEDNRIVPKNSVKILGVVFSNNLTWANHLYTGKESIVNKCKQKLAALKFTASKCSVKMKKRLVDACILSRLTYGIQLWGIMGKKSALKKVQTVQNLSAAWILNKPIYTKSEDMIKELNWLSINQLSYYHSVLSIWKIERMGEPKRNYISILRGNERNGRIELTDRIWSIRAQEIYRRMDSSITGAGKVSQFKKRLKVWIRSNIPQEEPPD